MWELRKLLISLHIKSWNLNFVYCLAKTEVKLSSTGYFWLLVLLTGNNWLDHGNARMIIKNINKPLVCSFPWKDVGGKKCISTDSIHVSFASFCSISKQFEDFHYSQRELTCTLWHIMYYLTNTFNILLEFYPFPWHQPVPWLQRSLALTKTQTLRKNCMQQRREWGGGQPWVFTKSRQRTQYGWREERKHGKEEKVLQLAGNKRSGGERELRDSLLLLEATNTHTHKQREPTAPWGVLTEKALEKFLH